MPDQNSLTFPDSKKILKFPDFPEENIFLWLSLIFPDAGNLVLGELGIWLKYPMISFLDIELCTWSLKRNYFIIAGANPWPTSGCASCTTAPPQVPNSQQATITVNTNTPAITGTVARYTCLPCFIGTPVKVCINGQWTPSTNTGSQACTGTKIYIWWKNTDCG